VIEIELTKEEIGLLFPALKQAESAYTERGDWKACKELDKIYNKLHKQVYTYGQLEGEPNE
jgi:hypothetical protein